MCGWWTLIHGGVFGAVDEDLAVRIFLYKRAVDDHIIIGVAESDSVIVVGSCTVLKFIVVGIKEKSSVEVVGTCIIPQIVLAGVIEEHSDILVIAAGSVKHQVILRVVKVDSDVTVTPYVVVA